MISHQIIRINFHFSVWLAILLGIVALNVPDRLLADPESMYGPLRNNLLIVVGYLLISEIFLWFFRYLKNSYIEALIMGSSFLLTAAGAEIYGAVNRLPISPWFTIALVYFGVSHLLYFVAKPNTASTPRQKT